MRRYLFLLFIVFPLFPVCLYAQWGPRSKVVTDTIYSRILQADRAYTIYLPKSYNVDSTHTYPILYLLHGVMGINTSWFSDQRAGEVADLLMDSGEACEMIIVSPNAGGNPYKGDWNGYFNMPGWAYEDFFYKEFLPYIERTYRVKADKCHRAIAGLSMGGGGTTSYALRYPEMYCAAYAISALMDIPEVGAMPSQSPDDKMAILTKSVQKHSCIKYVQNADEKTKEKIRSVQWFVDCGDDDFLLDRNIEFFKAMRQAQIPLQFRVRDGGHINDYWHSALYICLPFVSRCFER